MALFGSRLTIQIQFHGIQMDMDMVEFWYAIRRGVYFIDQLATSRAGQYLWQRLEAQ